MWGFALWLSGCTEGRRGCEGSLALNAAFGLHFEGVRNHQKGCSSVRPSTAQTFPSQPIQ